MVDRFLNQQETRAHLNELKDEHTKQLARLKEEKVEKHKYKLQIHPAFLLQDKLQAQFEEMKYSGEERMSSGQRLLEEVQTHLNEAKTRWASLYPLDLYSVTHYTHILQVFRE